MGYGNVFGETGPCKSGEQTPNLTFSAAMRTKPADNVGRLVALPVDSPHCTQSSLRCNVRDRGGAKFCGISASICMRLWHEFLLGFDGSDFVEVGGTVFYV